MPRFVILEHRTPAGHCRPLHWDFMLQLDGVLRTWALSAPPGLDQIVEAEALADHRLAYLDYAGPVSNNRGHVSRWDAGLYELLAIAADCIELKIWGQRLAGRVKLERDPAAVQRWTFSCRAA